MVFSLIVGVCVLFIGATSYLVKRKEINKGSFRSASTMVIVVTSAVSALILLLGVYFITIL
jgi:putative membrane protein